MSDLHWIDTTNVDAPPYHNYSAALWLLGRHQELAELAARVPGVVLEDHELRIDLELLGAAVVEYDNQKKVAWDDYRCQPQSTEAAVQQRVWMDYGPPRSAAAEAIAEIGGFEISRLRLLAALSAVRVPLGYADFRGINVSGEDPLVRDWMRIMTVPSP